MLGPVILVPGDSPDRDGKDKNNQTLQDIILDEAEDNVTCQRWYTVVLTTYKGGCGGCDAPQYTSHKCVYILTDTLCLGFSLFGCLGILHPAVSTFLCMLLDLGFPLFFLNQDRCKSFANDSISIPNH